ncbi:putative signaling protein [Metapseudomonas resinovorans]|uniref:putative bifunctional diguanylate cyclase/phosphodiesterase n=1 Tax=Metapseudomonas resinovorans TaxID=53412 RepID=UPI00098460EF|nr:EAL domain-containing protein [Pseudomonas resinovorans]GLZ85045.1 putative signaling protein [Pseudomonas resinovorans]
MLFLTHADAIPDDQIALLDCSHSTPLVLLSYLVACAAAFTALAMARRVSHSGALFGRELWRWVGALTLGGGIWSMHFIAMLAFRAPVPIAYSPGITLLSLLIAIAVSYVVMRVIGRERLKPWQYLAAAIAAGTGIATMHYSGMVAIRSAASLYYDPLLFALSVSIAIGAALAALLLTFYFRERNDQRARRLRLAASAVMGAAIVSMHFTGMAALTLTVPRDIQLQLDAVSRTGQVLLGSAIGVIALLVIVTGLGAAWAEQRLREQRRRLRTAADQLNTATHHDPLTNLFNGRAFTRMTSNLLAEHDGQGTLAVLFIGLDGFKRINDSLGHGAGDLVLQQVAQRLRTTLHDQDLLARYSGDEFCILSPLTDGARAGDLADRLLGQIRAPISLPSGQLRVTASLGLSLYPQDGETHEELLRNAGLALGHCKENGRNRWQRFSADLELRAHENLTLEQDLRRALNEDALEVHYQPIVASDASRVVSLEAVARWRHPLHGMISPGRFVTIAEQHGFIAELDTWVMRRACRDLKELHDAGHRDLRVAVNCSALNFSNRNLPLVLGIELQRSGLNPRALTLEVTENALMGNLNSAVEILEAIRALGVSISIDDFGSGYSSLAYLRRLPVDTLKVDRAFVRDIPAEENDMAITAAIIAMAHKLQLKVVAEGVETAQQLGFLRENNCDLIQGYLFSRPLPLANLKQWLANPRNLAMATQPHAVT